MNSEKIILDLCGGTGAWSRPYKEAGYDVRLITYPEYDVRTYNPPAKVHGILIAPPCTDFSIAGCQLWEQKDKDGRTIDSLSIVMACLKIVAMTSPEWWVLENPKGRLSKFLGQAQFWFRHSDYGEPVSKLTYLWGKFNPPMPYMGGIPEEVVTLDRADKYFKELEKGYKADHSPRAARRSITPSKFAEAFYEANK